MWQVNCNYKSDNTGTKRPLYKNQKTLQSMCWNVKKLKGEWEEILEIFRKNKKKREVVVIKGLEYQNKIIKENRKKNKVRKTKVKEKKE